MGVIIMFIVLQYRTNFTIKLLSTDLNKISSKYTCTRLLENSLDNDDFLDYTGIVQCNYGSTATIVRLTSDYSNKMITSGNQCDNGIKKMTTIDSSQKCSKNF